MWKGKARLARYFGKPEARFAFRQGFHTNDRVLLGDWVGGANKARLLLHTYMMSFHEHALASACVNAMFFFQPRTCLMLGYG